MKILPITPALAALLVAGCTSTQWYVEQNEPPPRQQAERKEHAGVVESVREVQVDTERTGVGPMVGAVFGGAAGSSVGQGRGSSAGAVVGTVIGGIVGEAAAAAATQPGLALTVRLDEGRTVVVTQPVTGETFRPGDRVQVISDVKSVRVVK